MISLIQASFLNGDVQKDCYLILQEKPEIELQYFSSLELRFKLQFPGAKSKGGINFAALLPNVF
jgi:hypothetical protein